MSIRSRIAQIAHAAGYTQGRVIVPRENAISAITNPNDNVQSKTIKDLNKASSQEQLEILTEINNDPEGARQLLESEEIGVDNKKAIKTIRNLIANGTPEVKAAAVETLFTYANSKPETLIIAAANGYGHEDADEILAHAKDFILSNNDDDKLQAASEMATRLNYHVTSSNQAVCVEENGISSKQNNFMYRLHSQKGTGRLIHDMLKEAGLYAANQDLVASHFELSTSESDLSVQNPLAKENIKRACNEAIMGKLGSWSSCNFNFEYKIPATSTRAEQQVHYTLEDFIESAAQDGPEKACEKFIENYTALIEYKESFRANNPNSSFLKHIEKEQEKALKFIFDPNKLKATSKEGAMIHAAIAKEMQEKGASSFLKQLFQVVMTPNQMAEIKKINIEYKEKYGDDLTYVDDQGVQHDSITIEDFRKSTKQMKQELDNEIKGFAQSTGLQFTSKEEHSNQRTTIEALAKKHEKDSAAFVQELSTLLPSITLNTVAPKPGFKQTTRDLKNEALKQVNSTFSHAGADHETHIKRGGARGVISTIRNKAVENLSPAEKAILTILNTDKSSQQKLRNGRTNQSGIIEGLLSKQEHGAPSVNSSIVAAQILLQKIDDGAALAPNNQHHIPSAIQAEANRIIKEDLLSVSENTQIPRSQNIETTISELNEKHTLLASLDDHIQYQAKDKFANEIQKFLSHAVPNTEVDVLSQSLEQLHELADNLHTIQNSTDDAEIKKLTKANLNILGIINSDNPLEADYTQLFGTLADPNIDSSLVDIFLTTVQQVIDMIKSGLGTQKK